MTQEQTPPADFQPKNADPDICTIFIDGKPFYKLTPDEYQALVEQIITTTLQAARWKRRCMITIGLLAGTVIGQIINNYILR